jgi:alkanesulfonate monooxygenase SsuD/methylene tetrahydromethanopterin reductase-like flavin-dependent oxidoreductase (luciferase family)
MRYGYVIFGAEARVLAELAYEAEAAGWDGVFVADGIFGEDPWVVLTTIALRTERVRLGPLITPVSRRRPWKLAQETATLDRLSGGRLILTAGLGAIDSGFDKVGEATDRRVRAQLLDEGLEIVAGLWGGRPFSYQGEHYRVVKATGYAPAQSPRIPIWVVGAWPRMKSMRRALRWDGLIVTMTATNGTFWTPAPADVRDIKAFVEEFREQATPFDIVVEGTTPGDDPARAREQILPLAEAGVSWWIESRWDAPGGMKGQRRRIRQGPPRLNA